MNWEALAKEKWQIEKLRPGQLAALQCLEQGQDCLTILPTGGGKSLIYQLYQLYQSASGGTTLIVSPLLSLMEDQVQQLKMRGFKRVLALNSQYSRNERADLIRVMSHYQFILLSPEMLCQKEVLQALKTLTIRLFVVDEAHCISQWGLSFRPEYTELNKVIKALNKPQILALTATANGRIVRDIQQQLFSDSIDHQLISVPLNRANLFYSRLFVRQAQKIETLAAIIQQLPQPGIIYVHHKAEIKQLYHKLEALCPNFRLMGYHGDMTSEERLAIQAQYQAGYLDCILATSAFGMGINQEFVRYVIHYHLPASMGEYLQEVGRCGRDGQLAYCLMLIDEYEHERLRYFKAERFFSPTIFSDLLSNIISTKNISLARRLEHFPIEQANVLHYFLNHYTNHQAAAMAYEDFYNKEVSGVEAMIDILETKTCIRQQLLADFSEEKLPKSAWCCSNCQNLNPKDANWQAYLALNRKSQAFLSGGQSRLAALLHQSL